MARLARPNKTSATAVTEIDAVYFHNNAGQEPVINAAFIASDNLFPVATLKGSVEINQEDITINKINIDQSNVPIGITTEPGDFNFAGDMPSMLAEDLGRFITQGSDMVHIDNKAGYGYTLDGKILEMAVIVRMKTGDYLIFPRTNVTCTLTMEDNVMLLHFAGQVLGATNPANKDVYILADPSVVRPESNTIDFGVATSAADDLSETLSITYSNIEGDITLTIRGDSRAQFSLSRDSITPTPNTSGVESVQITYDSSSSTATHTAELVISSSSGESVVALKARTEIV